MSCSHPYFYFFFQLCGEFRFPVILLLRGSPWEWTRKKKVCHIQNKPLRSWTLQSLPCYQMVDEGLRISIWTIARWRIVKDAFQISSRLCLSGLNFAMLNYWRKLVVFVTLQNAHLLCYFRLPPSDLVFHSITEKFSEYKGIWNDSNFTFFNAQESY